MSNKKYEWNMDKDFKPPLFGENITYEDINKRIEDMSEEDRAIYGAYTKMGKTMVKMMDLSTQQALEMSQLWMDAINKSNKKEEEL